MNMETDIHKSTTTYSDNDSTIKIYNGNDIEDSSNSNTNNNNSNSNSKDKKKEKDKNNNSNNDSNNSNNDSDINNSSYNNDDIIRTDSENDESRRWDVTKLNSRQKDILERYVKMKDKFDNLLNTSGIVQGLIISVIFSLVGTLNSQFWDNLQQNMIDGGCGNLFRSSFKFISNTTYAAIVTSLFNLLVIFTSLDVDDPFKRAKILVPKTEKILSEEDIDDIDFFGIQTASKMIIIEIYCEIIPFCMLTSISCIFTLAMEMMRVSFLPSDDICSGSNNNYGGRISWLLFTIFGSCAFYFNEETAVGIALLFSKKIDWRDSGDTVTLLLVRLWPIILVVCLIYYLCHKGLTTNNGSESD